MSIRIGGMALSYLAAVVLSRLLGVSNYGNYAIALSWALVLGLVAKAGFDNSSMRFATIYRERGDARSLRAFIGFGAACILMLSLVIGLSMVLVGGYAANVNQRLLTWTALMVPALALLTFYSVLMRTAHRVTASQFYEQMLRPLLIIIGAGAAWFAGIALNPSSALMITTIAAFAALAMLWLHYRRVFASSLIDRPDYQLWSEWLLVSLPMLLMGVVQELMNHIDVILLGVFADSREAGLFAASWRLASLVPFAFVGLSIMAAPLIASANERKAVDELFRISSLVARAGFAFALLASLLLFLGGKWLLRLFGADFVSGLPVLAVLLIGGLVNAFTGMAGYLMILTGRERQSLMIFAAALLLSVVLNLFLIPRFGAVGAAIASSSATAAWNLAMLVYVRRTMGIDASAVSIPPRLAPRDDAARPVA